MASAERRLLKSKFRTLSVVAVSLLLASLVRNITPPMNQLFYSMLLGFAGSLIFYFIVKGRLTDGFLPVAETGIYFRTLAYAISLVAIYVFVNAISDIAIAFFLGYAFVSYLLLSTLAILLLEKQSTREIKTPVPEGAMALRIVYFIAVVVILVFA